MQVTEASHVPGLDEMTVGAPRSARGYTRSGHRTAHMDHHLYLNTERDPDIIFRQPGAPAATVLRGLLGDLLLVSAIKRLLQYSQPADRATYSVSPWRKLTVRALVAMVRSMWPVILAQLGLLALFTVLGGPWAYLLLHVAPIMTLYPLQIRVRSIAEHGFEAGYEPANSQDAWLTRTSRLNPLERWIIAPLGQSLHYEHHVFSSIPNYNLPRVHRLLVAAGIPVPTNRTYFGFVLGKLRAEWQVGQRGTRE